MLSLKRLERAPIDDYDAIVKAKRKAAPAVLADLRPRILEAYSKYENSRGTPGSPIAVNDIEAACLKETYLIPTAPLNLLKAALADVVAQHADGRCPYCLIGHARLYDHNYPKEEYPEFSSCHLNLIFSCNDCNEKKSTTTGRVANLYFVELSGIRWLFAKVTVVGRLVIEYECTPPAGHPVASAIHAHYKALELCLRYRQQTTELLSEIARWCVDLDRELLRKQLRNSARNCAYMGQNYWKSVALEALASSDAALDWLAAWISKKRLVSVANESESGARAPTPPPAIPATPARPPVSST